MKEGNGRFVYAEGEAGTHNLQFVDPELIVGEVRWVLEGCSLYIR